MAVDIGIWLPTYTWDIADDQDHRERVARLRDYVAKCEDLGFDIWVIDHLLTAGGLYGTSWLEPMEALAFAAALTRRAKLGTGILVLPVRHPVVLAKEIATLIHLSENRYVFGVGPGWYPPEFTVTGSDISERGRRTDELIDAVYLLLSHERASFSGRYYRFEDVTIEPRPRVLPELWVSGGSRVPDPEYHDVADVPPSVLARIARSDTWLSRCSGTQEFLLRDWAKVQAHLEETGKGRDSVRFAHCNFIQMSPGLGRAKALEIQEGPARFVFGSHRPYEHLQECYLLGDVEHQVGRLAELAAHGMSYVVLGPLTDDLDQLDAIAEHLQGALGG